MVEKRWRTACRSENEKITENSLSYSVFSLFPSDSELAAAFVERKQRLVENFFLVFFLSCARYNFRLSGK